MISLRTQTRLLEKLVKINKDAALRGGGAVQNAWRAGYLGRPVGRHAGQGPGAISAIAYRAGKIRRAQDDQR